MGVGFPTHSRKSSLSIGSCVVCGGTKPESVLSILIPTPRSFVACSSVMLSLFNAAKVEFESADGVAAVDVADPAKMMVAQLNIRKGRVLKLRSRITSTFPNYLPTIGVLIATHAQWDKDRHDQDHIKERCDDRMLTRE